MNHHVPAIRRSPYPSTTLQSPLERSGEEVTRHLSGIPYTPRNREVVNHIVGIERWGQRRLRVALGEPPLLDTYRGYRLPEGADLGALRSAFTDTRRGTVDLARELSFAAPNQTKVRHNDLGALSIGVWLTSSATTADERCKIDVSEPVAAGTQKWTQETGSAPLLMKLVIRS